VLDDADTITFHFDSTPMTMPGVQVMHVAEGSILRLSDSTPILSWNLEFDYTDPEITVTDSIAPDTDLLMAFGGVMSDGAGDMDAQATFVIRNDGTETLSICDRSSRASFLSLGIAWNSFCAQSFRGSHRDCNV